MIIIPCVDLRNAKLDRDYVKFALTAYDILHVCEAEMGGLFFNEVRIQRKHEPVLGSVGSISRWSVLAEGEGQTVPLTFIRVKRSIMNSHRVAQR